MLILIIFLAAILALAFAAFNFASVKKLDEGTDKMQEIASAIRAGSNAFMNYEYKVLYSVVAVVAIIAVGALNTFINIKNKEWLQAALYVLSTIALCMGYFALA